MSSDIAISVENVSKAYRIWNDPGARLKAPLIRACGGLFPNSSAARQRFADQAASYYRDFYALKDISFQVRKGESVGIIGRNGSGKSTLLQIIAGTLQPTTGAVLVNGRVAALLELGSGFNPDFTGRENVYLNAAILGLTRAQTDERFEQIAAFAEIGEFLEQPVKTYSSGMMVRLAFAVQIAMEPEVLIVDEALSVGDMFFQSKCMARIKALQERNTAILLVSHDLQTVKSVCSRAVLLEQGRIDRAGDCKDVADRYFAIHWRALNKAASATAKSETLPKSGFVSGLQRPFKLRHEERIASASAQFTECAVFVANREVDTVPHGSTVTIAAWIQHLEALPENSEVGLVVRTLTGLDLFAVNSFFLNKPYPPRAGGDFVQVRFSFRAILAPGTYTVSLGIKWPIQGPYLDKVFGAAVFKVTTEPQQQVAGFFDAAGEIEFETCS